MRILIVDDHTVVREGLKQILQDGLPGAHFGEAAGATEALDHVWKANWDLVVLDISLPGRSGLELLKDIRQAKPTLPVLIMSAHSEEQYAVRVLRSGASGYVTKDAADEQLLSAVRRVSEGGRYVSPMLAERLAAQMSADTTRPLH